MAAFPPHPIGAGDTFAYTGTEQVTYSQTAPCAQPSSAATASVNATVTNYATSSPAGATTDQRSVESDAFPTKTVTTTTDLAVANTASAYQLFQTKTTDDSGNVTTMTYASPQQL
ncbi:MAG TPA: hypothetical protein VFL13_04195, partial [Candidatus Baltobacteraceae bacterium]|nr:hypothetical protein [Candidatus Baltobacteraceae bacterium]